MELFLKEHFTGFAQLVQQVLQLTMLAIQLMQVALPSKCSYLPDVPTFQMCYHLTKINLQRVETCLT